MFNRLLGDTNCTEPVTDTSGKIIDYVVTVDCFPIIVGNVIFWLLVLAGIVAVAMIIFSGFKFVTSGGDSKQAEGARKTLTFAVLGLVLILMSFIILPFIAKATGVEQACITSFGFTQCVPGDISSECSETNPSGFCKGDKECLKNKGFRGFSCQFRCNNNHPNGWCDGSKRCTEVRLSQEYSWEVDYLCR